MGFGASTGFFMFPQPKPLGPNDYDRKREEDKIKSFEDVTVIPVYEPHFPSPTEINPDKEVSVYPLQ